MIPGYPDQLYQELLCELKRIKEQGYPEDSELEESFGACMRYENKLREWVSGCLFDTKEDEINFFKSTRPKFSCQIQYYKKRYQAILFRPSSLTKIVPFFEYEIDKADKFFSDNAGFYQYYKSGQTFNDEVYFLRYCEEDADPDDPCRSETGYDLLLADIQGLEMYKDYVQQQLEAFRKI
jgi:hypothetical protein